LHRISVVVVGLDVLRVGHERIEIAITLRSFLVGGDDDARTLGRHISTRARLDRSLDTRRSIVLPATRQPRLHETTDSRVLERGLHGTDHVGVVTRWLPHQTKGP